MTGLPSPELGRRYDTWLECKSVAVEQRLVSSVLIRPESPPYVVTPAQIDVLADMVPEEIDLATAD